MAKLVIYSIIVLSMIFISLIIINKYENEENFKDKILKIFSLVTVAIHYSSLWVDYFTTGEAIIKNTMLLPVYPCNICMWLVVIYAFSKNKNSFIIKSMGEFLGFVGTVCGLIGLLANEIFLANPSFLDYDSVQGLLSHTTMIFTTTFILTQGYVKSNALDMTISTILGLILFAFDGFIVNGLMSIFNLPEVNSMYMLEFPLDIPGFNFIMMGLTGVIVTFLIGNIYEFLFVEKDKRWYKNLNDIKIFKLIKQED